MRIEWEWNDAAALESKSYICGHCGNSIASNLGYVAKGVYVSAYNQKRNRNIYMYICHYCKLPTLFNFDDEQIPGVIFGKDVSHLPPEVNSMYTEARKCYSAGAFTASVLCCRKLLMNITVTQGAATNLKFIEYVDWLKDNQYLPKGGEKWVDKIRTKGNEATHEIPDMKKEDAELLITFLEMLLKLIYEFPAKVP